MGEKRILVISTQVWCRRSRVRIPEKLSVSPAVFLIPIFESRKAVREREMLPRLSYVIIKIH